MLDLAKEIMARCEILARYSEDPEQLTRSFLSLPFKEVHAEITAWMQEAAMEVRVDAIGNIIGSYPAKDTSSARFLLGSHLDTVRNGGKYDGILGVLIGIALVKSLKAEKLPFGLEVIGFSDEEGVRFGATYFGSQAVTGSFDERQLELCDQRGISLRKAIEDFGLDPSQIVHAKYPKEHTLGYAEVHIEQGPVLESLDKPIGIAEAIIGQSKLELCFVGKAGHAGTVPMHLRQDALVGAAEFVLAVESCAKSTEGLVATVGKLEPRPGASNVIPAEVVLSLDVRHKEDVLREEVVNQLLSKAQLIAAERNLRLYHKSLLSSPTAWMSKSFTNMLLNQSQAPRMVSGAGHDTSVMSHFTQSLLIFVRSPGGISHHPDETVRVKDVAAALQALKDFLEHLAEAYV